MMTREEVFRGTGPTSGATIEVKLGAKKDGTHRRRGAGAEIPGRRLPRLAGRPGLHVRLRDVRPPERRRHRLRRGVATGRRWRPIARRARRSPRSRWRARSTSWRASSTWTRWRCARRTAARDGTKTHYGPTLLNIGYLQTLEAAKNHPHCKVKLGPNQGRGVASGFWFNIGGEFERGGARQRGRHGQRSSGNPDIGGSRASMA